MLVSRQDSPICSLDSYSCSGCHYAVSFWVRVKWLPGTFHLDIPVSTTTYLIFTLVTVPVSVLPYLPVNDTLSPIRNDCAIWVCIWFLLNLTASIIRLISWVDAPCMNLITSFIMCALLLLVDSLSIHSVVPKCQYPIFLPDSRKLLTQWNGTSYMWSLELATLLS
mgnify:CR=1 FL=1